MNYLKNLYKPKSVYYISLKKECCSEPSEIVVNSLQTAKEKVVIIAYKFDNVDIFNQLKKTVQSGVSITMILDYKNNRQNKFVQELKDLGVEIHLWKKTEKLHAKFMIVDDVHVLTGSFNLTTPTTTSSHHHKVDLIISLYEYSVVHSFIHIYNDMMRILNTDVCKECDGNLPVATSQVE